MAQVSVTLTDDERKKVISLLEESEGELEKGIVEKVKNAVLDYRQLCWESDSKRERMKHVVIATLGEATATTLIKSLNLE